MLGHAALGRHALGQMPSPVAIVAAVGAVALTGAAAGLSVGLTAGAGAFSATGNDATLIYAAGTRLTASPGAVSFFGAAATFSVGMPAEPGIFAATGIAAGLRITLPGATGAFVIGGAAGLQRALTLYTDPIPTRLPGNHFLFAPLGARALGDGTQDAAQATSFVLNGQVVEFDILKQMAAASATFALSGQVADLRIEGYLPKIRVFPSVGRGARAVSRGTEPLRVFASTGHGTRRRAFGG